MKITYGLVQIDWVGVPELRGESTQLDNIVFDAIKKLTESVSNFVLTGATLRAVFVIDKSQVSEECGDISVLRRQGLYIFDTCTPGVSDAGKYLEIQEWACLSQCLGPALPEGQASVFSGL